MQSRLHFLVCILLFLSVMAGTAVAQHKAPDPIKLTWDAQEAVFPAQGHEAKIPAFKGANIDLLQRLPYYRLAIPHTHIGSFKVTEAVFAPFSVKEQQQFKGITFGTEPIVEFKNARQSKQPVTIVSILPIRRNPQTNQLEKLTRFSYSYGSATIATHTINRTANSNYSNNSVLSAGEWYKLAVTQSGIHKIDRATLQALGINTQGLDPKTIQIFGNGGGMLPQPNSSPVLDDLQENAIVVSGEQDGQFNDNDFILFYGQGPHTWNYNPQQNKFEHTYNLYSDTTFYFLRVGYTSGARVQNRPQATGPTQTITTFNERAFHERDMASIIHSGREWYGEDFSTFNPSREVSFPVTGIVPNSEIKLTAAVMGNSATDCSFSLKMGSNLLGTIPIAGRGTYNYHPEGVNGSKTFTFNQQQLGSATEAKAGITFNMPSDATATGYLNYLELNYNRQLKLYNDQTAFRATATIGNSASTYRIADAPATAIVWDITDPLRPLQQQTNYSGTLQFTAPATVLREFIVFTDNNISLKPIIKGKVTNQNLHSLNLDGTIDHVILTHPSLLQEAKRLATHRNAKGNLKSIVVTTTQVYNEFSSGAQDVTAIRNFMRMLYKRSTKPAGEPMYLLLLGDASYDYKNRIPVNTNLVPVYESRQSLHPIASYSSEDYYGFLDEEEGEWAENNLGDHLLDIGIGRLPAKNPQEVAVLVDKIIAYESNSHFGKWRSEVTLVSDDGDFNEHQEDAEFLADFLENNAPDYTTNKLYLDLYRQEAVANGQRAPKLNQDLTEAVEKGTLLVNYTGHGNEVSWASEQILTLPQVTDWQNPDNLTFMLTATCEFGRYDDPARVSGAEVAMLHANGAAVGLVTTTRPVYSSSNRVLNRNFFKSAFTPTPGTTPRLGDLVLQTKNNSITDNISGSRGVYNRNFTLLCDPAVRLASPDLKAEITYINGKAVSTDTLSALGKVTMQGQITADNGKIANYSGTLRITIYEKQTTQQTFGDENAPVVPVTQRQNVLYEGSATIANGLFSVAFVVPKDIAYQYGPGKITLYASNNTQDALGANTTITVGGTARNIATDNTPPTINLYLEDESFVFGGSTGQHPSLLVKLFDENGINTAGLGIGHELIAIVDNNEENPVILNDYYTSEKDSYQRGRVSYSLKDLSPGPHSIRFKAWDTHNNASEEYIEFFVSNTEDFSLDHVLNYPNPFSTKTTFHFDHNRAGEDLDIQVQIYTISGKLVKTLQTISMASPAHVAALTWNGRDEYNDLLARGVYVYKISVRTRKDGAGVSKFEKLVILN
ncbi:type IX secretion system sortase PorU [Pontibacter fetidus]|uniref:Type IX secretion system sortase PorU n=1 Tax=Pontibacter fetidus TaxID=2700082 RepID=A0A6B2H1W5_9BACT|nr:type IX secretion system sortase PorU [Pontibacter fetidus]NDK57095.1 type IX secretion system sortase PorU [Pontibacter fetidus]